MEQVIVGGYRNTLNTSTTEYSRLSGGYSWNAAEGAREQLVSTDGVLKNLFIELDDVPGTGTYTFTLRLNGAPTGLTCTVAADGTTASDVDPAHAVTITARDRISLECNPDSPDNTRYARWNIMFEGDNAGESLILGGTDNTIFNGGTEYNQIAPTGSALWNSDELRMPQVIPTAGKIKNLYVELSADPGTAPDAYRFTLRLDTGAGLGSTLLTVTIVADNTTGFNVADEITVAAGDIVTLMCEELNGPSVEPFAIWGMTFVADTDGESLILGGTPDNPSNSVTEFLYLTGQQVSVGAWNSTESSRFQLGQSSTLKKLYVVLENNPNPGSYTFTVRVPDSPMQDGNLAVTITSGNTTGNDTARTDVISDGDTLAFKSAPASSPTTGNVYWGLVSFIEAGVTHLGAATLSGVGTLTGIGSFWWYGVATLTGVGTLAGIGRGIFIGQVTLTGTGTLASIGRLIAIGKATLSGVGLLSAIGSFWQYGVVTLSGVGSLSAIGSFWRYAKATLSGQGSLSAIGSFWQYGKVTLSGIGTLTAILTKGKAYRKLKTFMGRNLSDTTNRDLSPFRGERFEE